MFLPLCRDEKEDISCSLLSAILATDDCEVNQKAEQTFSIFRFGLVLLFLSSLTITVWRTPYDLYMLYFLPQVMARLTRKMGHFMLILIQIHLIECKILDMSHTIAFSESHILLDINDKEFIVSQKCTENTKLNEDFYQPDKRSLRFLFQHLFLKDRTKTFQLHYQLRIMNTTTK